MYCFNILIVLLANHGHYLFCIMKIGAQCVNVLLLGDSHNKIIYPKINFEHDRLCQRAFISSNCWIIPGFCRFIPPMEINKKFGQELVL